MVKDTGYIKKLIKNTKRLGRKKITVGILGSGGGDLQVYALTNEFGTRKAGRKKNTVIPERSYFRSTLDSKLVKRKVAKKLNGFFNKSYKINKNLNSMGNILVSEIQRKIRSNVPPPNKPSTIARKKSNRTLIDTRRLLNSIDFDVN